MVAASWRHLINWPVAVVIVGISVLAAAPAHAQYVGPGPAPPPSGPQTLFWQNASGGSFTGQNWGATAYLYGNGPQPPMPPDYQVGVYTGTHWGSFQFQAAPGPLDTAIFGTVGTGYNNPQANYLPSFPGGIYLCCSLPSAVGYSYPELPAGTKNYTVALGGGTVAELDAYSADAVNAAPAFSLGGFTATNQVSFSVADGANPILISGGGSLKTKQLYIAGVVNVTDGTLAGDTTTIDTKMAATHLAGLPVTRTLVTVSGSQTVLKASSGLYIGETAGNPATLDLTTGATATTGNVYLGFGAATANGSLGVNNASVMTNGFAIVGYDGIGNLSVQNGGRFTLTGDNGLVDVSGNAGSTGTALVTGSGSVLATSSYIIVGQAGTGTLTVASDGSVDGGDGVYVGNAAGGTGTLTITSGGRVLAEGGSAASGYAAILGGVAGATGNATVTGTSSLWTVAQMMRIGSAGTGTVMVTNGGRLEVDGDSLEIGALSGGNGTLTVDGAASSVAVPTGQVVVAGAGNGTLTVRNGAAFNHSGALMLGNQSSGFGTLQVTGNGSSAIFDSAIIGNLGSGMATVSNGGSLTVNNATQIGEATAVGHLGTLTVTGQASIFKSDGDLTIGDAGGGQMIVNTNARAEVGGGLNIGVKGGGTLLVDNANFSDTAANNEVNIGEGVTGSVTVQNAGTFDAATSDVTLADESTATGTVVVTGAGSSFNAGQLTVGGSGMATLTAQQGASLTTGSDATIADESGSKGTVTITDQNTALTVGGDLTVGGQGMAMLTETEDSAISVGGKLVLGEEKGGNGKMFVNGGNTLNVGGEVTIGGGGSGSLTVQQGALFNAKAITLGERFGGSGTLTVTGGGSEVTVNADANIGGLGAGSVTVNKGGELVDKAGVTLAADAAGSKGSATVNGSSWIVDGDFTAGGAGLAAVTVSGGGKLLAGGDTVLADAGGSIGTVTVTGADGGQASTLSYAQTLTVGQQGDGQLLIQKGGTVKPGGGGVSNAGVVEVAAKAGSIGTISLSGAGSRLSAKQLSIGGTATAAGGVGVVAAASSGTVAVGSDVMLWKKATLNVSGGGSASIGATQRMVANTVTVTKGGTLSGVGTIKGRLVNAGGTVHVGDDPGTITVQGDYEQDAGSSLTIEIGLSSTSLLDVTGSAAINGGTLELVRVDGGMINLGQTYDVLNAAGGVSGAFTTVATDSPFIMLQPVFSDGVSGMVAVHAARSFARVAGTSNQAAVAQVFDSAAANVSQGDLYNGLNVLSNSNAAVVRSSFDSLSGEAYGDLATVAIGQSSGIGTAMLDQLAAANGANAPEATANRTASGRYNIWAEGTGNFGNNDGNAYGSHSFSYSTSGMAAGFDTPITRSWLAGLAFGYGHSDLGAGSLQSNADMDDYDFALYSGWTSNSVYVRGAMGYMGSSASLSRTLDVAGVARFASGDPNGKQMFGSLETGDDFTLKSGLLVVPFARLDAARYWQDSTTETGAGAFGLDVAGETVSSAQTTLGAALSKVFAFTDLPLTALVKAGWGHEFADTDRPVSASFTGAAGLPFTVEAVPVNRNTAIISAGLSATIGRANIFLRYNGQYGSLTNASAVTGGIAITW